MTPERWQQKVYGIQTDADDAFWDEILRDDWAHIRRKIIRRDHQRCRRCEKKLKYDECSIHHIKPRKEGGSDNEDNLICLCENCHDWIECQTNPPLRTKVAIEGSMPLDDAYTSLIMKPVVDDGEFRPNWHRWVYGSGKNPLI